MWVRRLILFLVMAVLLGQSIHNAYGLGLMSFNHNAASSAMFFCQAEDGIRDSPVTGVQTCAIPILSKCP